MNSVISRRGFLGGLAATSMLSPNLATAAYSSANRSLHMVSPRTGESLKVRYQASGIYVPDALRAIDRFFRDWRTGAEFPISITTLDILSSLQATYAKGRPITLLSGYRSEATNAMLSRKQGGVAKNSLHMRGLAADIRIEGLDMTGLAEAAEQCGAGGIGLYRSSGFVHIDCGRRRKWSS